MECICHRLLAKNLKWLLSCLLLIGREPLVLAEKSLLLLPLLQSLILHRLLWGLLRSADTGFHQPKFLLVELPPF